MNKKKVKFGAITSPTPQWARWMFRGTAIITSVVALTIAADPAIANDLKIRILLYLKGIDLIVLGFANMFGIQVDRKPL